MKGKTKILGSNVWIILGIIVILDMLLLGVLWRSTKPKYGKNRITRWVTVDRAYNSEAVLETLKDKGIFLNLMSDPHVLAIMPRNERKKIKIYFFRLGGVHNDDKLEKEYARRNLKPVDPSTLIALNMADPSFMEKYPNATHWKDKGKWYYAAFYKRGSERCLEIRPHTYPRFWGHPWSWWFAGLRR